MLKSLALAGAALLLLGEAALAGERLRLMEVPLGIPLDGELDGEYLEGIYQEKLLPELSDSVLVESPIARIESTFSNERTLKIWFTAIEDGRRAYWLALDQAYAADKPAVSQAILDDFEARYGKADLVIGTIGSEPGPIVAVRIDPYLEKARRDRALRELVAGFKVDGATLARFWQMDMRQRSRLLGPVFRGAILSFYDNAGKTNAATVELLDLVAARSVLNLDP